MDVAYHYFHGDSQDNLTMTVIWSTKKLISRSSTQLTQDDATYKSNRYKFPKIGSGRSTPTGRIFMHHVALSSHEDTSSWVRIYSWVKSILGENPRYV